MPLLFIFGLAWSAAAADWTRLRAEGYVSDFAHVIDAASKQEMEQYLAGVERATGAQIAIVTISSLEGDPVEDVANTLYRHFGVGQKATHEGALFLLAIAERKSRLEVGYGLEPIVPDGAAGDILRAMRPALRAGRYGPALIEAARVLGTRIATAKNVAIPDALPRRPVSGPPGETLSFGQILLILGVVILFAWWNRGRRGRSNLIYWGGFGGGRTGGGASWGGFGGGDAGGGGASSDW